MVALGDVGALAPGELGLDVGAGVVVDGAAVHVRAVAGHRDGEAHELESLVGRDAELLHAVGVVGQRPQGVDGVGGDVGGAREPHARVRVERGLVDRAVLLDCGVVGVGPLGVRVPGAGSVDLPVCVGDDDVGLARGLGGHQEGDPGEALHAGAVHLHKVQVAADDLVVHRVLRRGEQRHRAVLADLEGAGPLLVEQVARRCLCLAHEVGAVGQAVGGAEGESLRVRREREARVPGLHELPVDEHCPLARVVYGELGALEGRAAERAEAQRLAVLLGHVEAPANHLVGVLLPLAGAVYLPVLADRELPGPVVVREVAGRWFGLADLVGAVGQQVRWRCERSVVGVGGAAPDALAWLVRRAAHGHRS